MRIFDCDAPEVHSKLADYGNYRGYHYHIGYDSSGDNPRTWSNITTLKIHDNRLSQFQDKGIDFDALEESDVFWMDNLYLYDHSGYALSINPRDFPDRRWDVSLIGQVIILQKTVEENFPGQKRSEQLRQVLACIKTELEVLQEYINGEVYYFKIYKDGEEEVQCFSMYDVNYVDREVKSIIDSFINDEEAQRWQAFADTVLFE